VTVPVVDGGFDPVPFSAAAGDQLEVTLTYTTGAVSVAYARVPPKRPPVVVRTFPTQARTDVALSIIPTVIFSEPIDERTLPAGVRLFRGDEEVAVAVEMAAEPWEARVGPAAELDQATTYELRITREVQDLEGDSLETPLTIAFTTEGASPPLAPWGNSRIAFDRQEEIFLGQPDGTIARLRLSPVCDTPSGYAPRLSPDGTRLLFLVGGMSPDYICVIELDGSNDHRLDWGLAAWSADGTRILSVEGKMVEGDHRQELYTINADGSGAKRLLSNSLPSDINDLDVSPDGTIAFGAGDGEIWLMDANGSRLRRVGGPDLTLYDPDWSPDGARIAYAADGERRTIGSMAADGSDARIHFRTAAGERAFGPEWSPDGRSIAFALFWSASSGGPGIDVVNLESGSLARLVNGEAGPISWAAVKP
jgi:Tol biopolymer transport system component